MKRTLRIATAVLMLGVARELHGQGANIDVTVTPQTPLGQSPLPRDGFLVCIGTENQRDRYGREVTPASGVANRNFLNLPVGVAVEIHVEKPGFLPVRRTFHTNSGWRNHAYISMVPGAGGTLCPPVAPPPPKPPPLTLSATSITELPPTRTSSINPVARPARLGEEVLAWHGETGGGVYLQTLDCRSFGTNFVMIGIQGKSGQAVDELQLVCAPLLRDGTLGPARSVTARFGGGGGTPFTPRRCGSGEAVSGISGHNLTYEGTQLRRLIIHCRAMNASGLGTGSPRPLDGVGSSGSNTAPWGPDNCTSNRPARALVVDKWPFRGDFHVQIFVGEVVAAVRLICEQPVRPTL